MPYCALVAGSVLCMHGGLSPHLTDLDAIRRLPPMREPPNPSLALDLMWSDPKDNAPGRLGDASGWQFNSNRQVISGFALRGKPRSKMSPR